MQPTRLFILTPILSDNLIRIKTKDRVDSRGYIKKVDRDIRHGQRFELRRDKRWEKINLESTNPCLRLRRKPSGHTIEARFGGFQKSSGRSKAWEFTCLFLDIDARDRFISKAELPIFCARADTIVGRNGAAAARRHPSSLKLYLAIGLRSMGVPLARGGDSCGSSA